MSSLTVSWENTGTVSIPEGATVATIQVVLRNVQTLEGLSSGFVPGAIDSYFFGELDDGTYEVIFLLYDSTGTQVYGCAPHQNGITIPKATGSNKITNAPESVKFTITS